MCGIAGLITRNAVVEPMVERLRHRGPDDCGVWRSVDGTVQLGHTRLSVLDLSSAGRQPMVNPEGDVAVVYNGEVYNYPELASGLRKAGVVLRSSCDTEAVLYLYIRHGVDCFRHLEGMFAIALYDTRTQTLVLARDRAGKKPLYWSWRNGVFAFASEIKALNAVPELDLQVDTHALLSYLQFDYVPTPSSIYKGVQKLLPGHTLVFRNGHIRIERFWSLDAGRRFGGSYADACCEMDTLLEDAVRRRLLSDVPLGVFLSGGLDSSSVAYYAAKHHRHIQTFSIAFEDPTYDESGYARRVAQHLHTRHHEWVVRADDLLSALQHGAALIDEPLGDASIIPTFLLARYTRRHVTVAVGGDGGDELFAGYPTFLAEAFARRLEGLPHIVWRMAERIFDDALPPSSRYMSHNFVAKRFVLGMQVPRSHRHQRWLGAFSYDEAKALLHPDLRHQVEPTGPYVDLETWQSEIGAWACGNAQLYEYFRTYLMDEVMVKVDRASMAVSLEARSPFLDYRVIELAFSLPYAWKFHRGRSKRILKDIMRGRLPDAVIDRKKKGFGMPTARWLRVDLLDWTREMLRYLENIGILTSEALALHNRHLAGREDLRKPLWNLVALAHFLQSVQSTSNRTSH